MDTTADKSRALDNTGRTFVVWLTGLSGAGKTTLARLLERELVAGGTVVEVLDGDVVRTHLSKGLGYSREDRDTNIQRIAWVASRLARAGAVVIVAAISPYAKARQEARELVEEHAPFLEIHVSTSLEACARRDPKGLYAKAFRGELLGFTGVSDPYQEPEAPDLRLDTERLEPNACVERVTTLLRERKLMS